jgi:hypothetical protein
MRSKIFEKIVSSEIGRKLPGSFESPDLKIGTRIAIFNSDGKIPWERDDRLCCLESRRLGYYPNRLHSVSIVDNG